MYVNSHKRLIQDKTRLIGTCATCILVKNEIDLDNSLTSTQCYITKAIKMCELVVCSQGLLPCQEQL